MNVVRILAKGSMNSNLHNIAVDIFNVSAKYNLILVPEWIPRNRNTKEDALSRMSYSDYDDWQVNSEVVKALNAIWGPFTLDRFATDRNNKCKRFNSRIWVPGTEAVNCLSVPWSGELNWWVPPPCLIPAVLSKIAREGAEGVLVVPRWTSAPYWTVLCPGGKSAPYWSVLCPGGK
jgi:hypothetical protein